MANVVGVLWQMRVGDALIMPARIPLSHERVRASVLYPLDPAFSAVVDREVDGDGSLPSRMEANPSRRMSQARAATRAARAVFMCSAPLVGQPNAGVNGLGLRLACAEPGDQLAIFGEALRELHERATYLYEEGGRYWFSTQPTLNRLAEDRSKAFPDHEVDEAITAILRDDGRTTGGFHKVFAAPDDPISLDEAQALSLVILSPSAFHIGKAVASSPATAAVTEGLTRCRAAQRRYRNTLIYVAADEALLATARDAMRRSMAWAEIVSDTRLQDTLTRAQIGDAKDKATTSRDGAAKAIRLAWSHVFLASKSDATPAGQPFELDHVMISTKDRAAIPAAVYDKVGPRGDGLAKEKLGPDNFWALISKLWPEDVPHLAISDIADWFASYPYLPKVRDRVVVETAIQDGAAKLDAKFGYADAVDASGHYTGLRWARGLPDVLPSSAVLVRPEAANAQIEATAGSAPSTTATAPAIHRADSGSSPTVEAPSVGGKPTRFYGSVDIDVERPMKSFQAIVDAVVSELRRSSKTKVTLTLEIEATAADGFDEGDVGVVRDNARQLKFTPGSTGFE